MAANINGSLRVAGQVLNLKPENLAADPTGGGLVESRLWYNTVTKALKFYNGTAVASVGDVTSDALTAALVPYAQTTDVNSAITTAIADLVSGTEMQNAIDNALAGLDFQADVLGLETDYVATPGRYIYVDGSLFTSGVAAAAGDIVTVDAAGVILSVAYDVSVAGPGALTWNRDGAQWLRWNGTDWAEFGGLTGVTAGDGIEKTGDVIAVKASNASIVVAAGGISVGDLSATYVTPAAQTTAINTAVSGLQSAAQVTAAIDAALVPYAESADVTAEIATAVTGLASTTQVNNAIDNALAGLDFQEDILGFETDFVGVAGRYILVDGLSGITPTVGNANDIVEVSAGGEATVLAYDVSAQGPGALVWNRAAANGGAWYRWNGTNWAVFGGLSGFTAGNGLEDNEGTVSVKASNASIVVAAGGISVGDLSATYVTPAAQTTAINTAVSGLATAASVTAVSDRLVGSWYTITTNSANTTHTVTHNIGNRYPVVQVVDKATNKPVIPDDIEFTTDNEFVITLATAIDVIVSVIGLKPAA